jgi:hypothetical protein
MPPIVKACYISLIKNSNNRNVNLLTKDNYLKYVEFPPFIKTKLNKGIITLAHFLIFFDAIYLENMEEFGWMLQFLYQVK